MPSRSEILREVMREAGITQSELSQYSGVAQPSLSGYLSGRRTLSDDLLDRLLSCMGYRLVVERRPVKQKLLRSPQRSWLLHRQLVTHLTPETFREWRPIIERNLERQRSSVSGRLHHRNLDRWQHLIQQGNLPGLRRVMTGLDTDSIEMREVSPMMPGLLSQRERAEVLGLDHDKIQRLESKILGPESRAAETAEPAARLRRGDGREIPPAAGLAAYSEQRPYIVADSLDDLRGPTSGQVTLPRHLDWSGSASRNLDSPSALAGLYQTVLNEASSVTDLNTWLNKDKLIELWLSLWLPPKVRRIWNERFPELAGGDPRYPRQRQS